METDLETNCDKFESWKKKNSYPCLGKQDMKYIPNNTCLSPNEIIINGWLPDADPEILKWGGALC